MHPSFGERQSNLLWKATRHLGNGPQGETLRSACLRACDPGRRDENVLGSGGAPDTGKFHTGPFVCAVRPKEVDLNPRGAKQGVLKSGGGIKEKSKKKD